MLKSAQDDTNVIEFISICMRKNCRRYLNYSAGAWKRGGRQEDSLVMVRFHHCRHPPCHRGLSRGITINVDLTWLMTEWRKPKILRWMKFIYIYIHLTF